MDKVKEEMKKEIISWAFEQCQPNMGDVFGWLDDNVDNLIDHLASRRLIGQGKPEGAIFDIGDRVHKVSGSHWEGKIVGFYVTELTPIGYAIESEIHRGSVQIYPEKAIALSLTAAPADGGE